MKYDRQAAILELIEANDIETQEELSGMLRARGFEVTQATVSRDIKDLKLVKISGGQGRSKYSSLVGQSFALPEQLRPIFANAFVSADYANNLVIVKTLPGMAQAVASAVDVLKIGEILGTVAGDDSVLIVCSAERYAEDLVAVLCKMAR